MRRTIDPDGRTVLLTDERWAHILERHEELFGHLDLILDVVARPDVRLAVRAVNEEWFLCSGVGPSRWLQVVVHYGHGFGRITTAFARRSLPAWM